MNEISVSITAGNGSEIHNHDLDYRKTLEHVHASENGVIELINYDKNYQEKINEIMKPYIDEYNRKVESRYKAAWDRYNSGQIKTKPRKRDYKKMGYDYYSDHLEDTYHNQKTGKNEPIPMFRSLIFGLGDQQDRVQEHITEKQATMIFLRVVEDFQKDFPDFHILGASMHLDEEGYYHMHLDFKPVRSAEMLHGLQCITGFDSCMEAMGYEPEQSIINGRDKVPIQFNSMRNQLYRRIEAAMNNQDLLMMYKATEIKEPGKDSSKNQKLEDWQATQDAVKELQHEKNVFLNTMKKDYVTSEEVTNVFEQKNRMEEILKILEESNKSRITKKNLIVPYALGDQMKSVTNHILTDYANMLAAWNIDYEKRLIAEEKVEELREERNFLIEEHSKFEEIRRENIELKKERARFKNIEKQYKQILKQHNIQFEPQKINGISR